MWQTIITFCAELATTAQPSTSAKRGIDDFLTGLLLISCFTAERMNPVDHSGDTKT
jgi:hypothetical protein